ncbi:MAG: dephospho-CoA kinase [bacterium]|nr:dephospho-CoA kinase [bacterium]
MDARRQRLTGSGMEKADIDARMAAQPSASEWTAAADFVIHNNGALEDLEQEVDRLLVWVGDL